MDKWAKIVNNFAKFTLDLISEFEKENSAEFSEDAKRMLVEDLVTRYDVIYEVSTDERREEEYKINLIRLCDLAFSLAAEEESNPTVFIKATHVFRAIRIMCPRYWPFC